MSNAGAGLAARFGPVAALLCALAACGFEDEALVAPDTGGGAAAYCAPGVLCVGPHQRYATLQRALAAARNGDVIEIAAGTYRETARITIGNLTLRGVAGRPHFDCAGLRIADDKACLLLVDNGTTLENLEISGAVISEGLGANGACIRNEHNASFTLRAVVCHGSQDGILSDGGNILIEDSEFYDNGWDGSTHNVYFSGYCSVTVRRSTFRDARVGHEFKSRCVDTEISDSTVISSRGSRNLDLSEGGEVGVYRTTLVKTPGAENYEIIGFAPESCPHPGDLLLKDVRIVNSQPEARITNYDKCRGHPIIFDGVTVEGFPPQESGYIIRR